jgi:M6 family metalloprotease-like protein
MIRFLVCLSAILTMAAAPPSTPSLNLSEYRTADSAVPAKVSRIVGADKKGTGYLGIHASRDGDQLVIGGVHADSPAASVVKKGDILLKIDGTTVNAPEALREVIQSKVPGDHIALSLIREGKTVETTVALAATSRPLTLSTGRGGDRAGKGRPGGFFAPPPLWKKPVYRLAVVVIEYPDIKANKKITPRSWEAALFSNSSYRRSPTGQVAQGSLADYFREQSHGQFRLEGRAFAPVQVARKRGEYVEGTGTSNKAALPTEALGKLIEREGEDRLTDFDGVCFIYAGSRTGSNRGSLYYPHQGALSFQGKRLNYILGPEGGSAMEPIGLFAVEVGKLLGLPSLAARTENAGSEGLGKWCLMSDGAQGARPGHLCAWCKEQLGWLTPVVLNPMDRQKLVLGSVQDSPRECFKVLVRLDGSEYFLLENRRARGFDADLPAQGLLIWRVSGGRPILEESHGVAGPKGPTVHPGLVPYPSKVNNAFTPITTPSSRSIRGGGLPVNLTNIRRLPDGRVTLHIGYEYQ